MTKAQKQETEESKAVATKTQAGLPAGMDLTSLQADAGAGSSNITADDMQTPIISILQANSPQCKRSDGKYIQGASEGMLYNNVTNEIYNGEEGIKIVPCFFEKVFIEWKPNRGGLVAIHGAETPLKDKVKEVETPDGKIVPTLPNGNQLIETNQHYVLLVKDDGSYEPAVLALSSSALKSSRQLNTLIKRVVLQGPNGPFNPASYYSMFKLTTSARQNDQHSWFGWTIENLGAVPTMDLYNAGKALEQAVNAGTVKVKQDESAHNPATGEVVDEEIPY
jgi:hypothetical protein